MVKFIKDKKNRTIYLKEINDIIYAYCGEQELGSIQFCVLELSSKYGNDTSIAYPEQMHLDNSYQRSGIATEIIKYAKEIYNNVQFTSDTGCGGNTDEIHYTSDGLAFKNFCEMTGITKKYLDYEDDE